MIKRYIVDEDLILKDYLKKIGIFSNIQKEIKKLNGQYLVNDQTVDNWYQLTKGDKLEIVFPASVQGPNIKSIKKDFEILYEDAYFLIINKESNIASIPTRKHYDKSLANYVMSYYKIRGIIANVHFIGRLDYATSGIIAIAKNPYILALMKQTPIVKQYLLEVEGIIQVNEGIIEGGIEKDEESIIKRKLSHNFMNSKTTYKVLKRSDDKTQVLATLHTGKTHQLRLHFASMEHPIIGDELYGNKTNDNILHLHSHYLEFKHPVNQKIIKIISTPKWFTP